MDFKESISKLKKSEEYKKFKSENKNSYLCTAFFIVDFSGKQNTCQLNFQISEDRVGIFSINDNVTLKIEELMAKKKILKLKENITTDVEEVVLEVKKEIKKNDLRGKVSKIIMILGVEGESTIWNATCFLEAMQILNVHVDAISGKVVNSQKMSIKDFFNKPADYIG
ncbi:MAG: hypothetical protein V1660_00480 [archaeon]